MSTWPFSCAAMIAWLPAIGSIVTCRPCRLNNPLSSAMYRPARSAAGRAATVMSASSGSGCAADDAELLAEPHPVTRAMRTDTMTSTKRMLRMLIIASGERLNLAVRETLRERPRR